MSEATRVEQSIEHTERVRFDLAAVVRSAGQAYQATFVRHRISVGAPEESCWVVGSPELIVQLLDKLLDNATSYAPERGEIAIVVEARELQYVVTVTNDGPLIPPEITDKMFESLVSSRGSEDSRPHLGLGLYIVRLIAEFHGGSVRAANRADGSGVVIAIEIPKESAARAPNRRDL
jgi:signal transduction histidine kinase